MHINYRSFKTVFHVPRNEPPLSPTLCKEEEEVRGDNFRLLREINLARLSIIPATSLAFMPNHSEHCALIKRTVFTVLWNYHWRLSSVSNIRHSELNLTAKK